MADKESASGGIGFAGLLFIVLLVLKTTHTVTWSWFWITAPLWGGLALAAGIMVAVGMFALIAATVAALWSRK